MPSPSGISHDHVVRHSVWEATFGGSADPVHSIAARWPPENSGAIESDPLARPKGNRKEARLFVSFDIADYA
jgi:hypothetical protein